MRRFRGDTRQLIGGSFPTAAVNAQNIHIHVTNVTQVMPVRAYSSAVPKRYPPKRTGAGFERKPIERPPKLFRYCASGGVLDRNVVYGMESDELCKEAVKCFGYTTCQLGSTARDMAHSACGIAEGVGEAAVGVGGILKGAFYVVAGLLGKDLA